MSAGVPTPGGSDEMFRQIMLSVAVTALIGILGFGFVIYRLVEMGHG